MKTAKVAMNYPFARNNHIKTLPFISWPTNFQSESSFQITDEDENKMTIEVTVVEEVYDVLVLYCI